MQPFCTACMISRTWSDLGGNNSRAGVHCRVTLQLRQSETSIPKCKLFKTNNHDNSITICIELSTQTDCFKIQGHIASTRNGVNLFVPCLKQRKLFVQWRLSTTEEFDRIQFAHENCNFKTRVFSNSTEYGIRI